eukprot:7154650-Prymnesium_polylepis.2
MLDCVCGRWRRIGGWYGIRNRELPLGAVTRCDPARHASRSSRRGCVGLDETGRTRRGRGRTGAIAGLPRRDSRLAARAGGFRVSDPPPRQRHITRQDHHKSH